MAIALQAFGWAASALLVSSLLQRVMSRLRVLNLTASLALIAYNALAGVWPMVGMNAVVAVIDVWFLLDGARGGAAAPSGPTASRPRSADQGPARSHEVHGGTACM